MNKPDHFVPYKPKSLKVYASKEWLADDRKKYRSVFNRASVSYIYAEFAFFNKYFDEQDWEFSCLLCAERADGEEICRIPIQRHVSKDENIVFIREGWGMDKPGSFWGKGEYRWVVIIDDTVVIERSFYIIDGPPLSQNDNPYFRLLSLALYEAGFDNKPENERIYYQAFERKSTRYVWVEFNAEKLFQTDESWECELFFNFYSDTGQLKGSVEEIVVVHPEERLIQCTVGWGSREPGLWFEDTYKLEVVFMDVLIGVLPFSVGNSFVKTEEKIFYLPTGIYVSQPQGQKKTSSVNDTLAELDAMIGLDSVKKSIREYITYLNFLRLRREKGIEENQKISLHTIFTGNPGTGKTTVASMLGKIYHDLGLLEKGHVHIVDRGDLVGEFIGQTAPKVKEAIKKAEGGILFIDEAYSLARQGGDTKDFGKEAIEILLKEMSDGENNIVVIAAGYPDEMKYFLDSNPGLRSRFNQFFHFPDYTPQELMQIAEYAAERRNVLLSTDAKVYLHKKLVDLYRTREKSFGNARLVNSLIDGAKMNLGVRIMSEQDLTKIDDEAISTITPSDIEKIFLKATNAKADIPVDEALLRISLREVQNLTGLATVKSEVDELVRLVRFYREIGKDTQGEFSLHTVFTGNPGTGKTTVARQLANIYKALGIVEKGHLIECDRQRLVAGYIGQTAEKTRQVLNEALDGVLFIDEAYNLVHDEQDSFGKEAVATILKFMEDYRKRIIIIMAGYPDSMRKLLNTNPGLKGRFDRIWHFEDYQPEELFQIASYMLANANIALEEGSEAERHLKKYFEELVLHRDKFFGNARTVRKVVDKVVKNQHLRLAKIPAEARTPQMLRTLAYEDVAEFNTTEIQDVKAGIGFRRATNK